MIKEKESERPMNKNRGYYRSFKWIRTINYTRTRKKDYLVIATMRNLEKQGNLLSQATQLNLPQNIKIQQLDVTDRNSLHNFQLFFKEVNKVNLLINNAGYANGGFVKKLQ